MGATRLRRNRLALTVGGEHYWSEVSSARLVPAYDKQLLLCGGYDFLVTGWSLELVAVQSTEASSLWSLIWDHATEVLPFTLAPNGNDIPSPERPHFTGTVQLPYRPSIGGDAAIRGDFTFSASLAVIGEPTKVIN